MIHGRGVSNCIAEAHSIDELTHTSQTLPRHTPHTAYRLLDTAKHTHPGQCLYRLCKHTSRAMPLPSVQTRIQGNASTVCANLANASVRVSLVTGWRLLLFSQVARYGACITVARSLPASCYVQSSATVRMLGLTALIQTLNSTHQQPSQTTQALRCEAVDKKRGCAALAKSGKCVQAALLSHANSTPLPPIHT